MKLKLLILLLFSFVLSVSCTTVPKKSIDEKGNHTWKSESFELFPQNQSFTAEGDVTMWVDVPQYHGKFTGDYQILSASAEKWRMIITGPFNVSVATVIINGAVSHIFHEGIWETVPWNEISKNLFNAPVDGDLLSVIIGGRFRFKGECAADGDAKVCRMGGNYYKMKGGTVTEIVSGGLYVVNEKGRWTGVFKGKPAFIFKNKKFDNSSQFENSLFELPVSDEKDEFDEL